MLAIFGYTKWARLLVKTVARLTGFWLKYLDYLAAPNPRAIDAASGVYFIGRKAEIAMDDRELITYYTTCSDSL